MKHNLKVTRMICNILLCSMLLLTGCSGEDKNGSMKAEDGRSYGGIIQTDMKDTVNTAFFEMKINSVSKRSTYQFKEGLYEAGTGNTYLIVDVTITNTFQKDLPMSITDFTLDFEGNDEQQVITGFGNTDLHQEKFMDNLFTLKEGESITKSILFSVKDAEEYILRYEEYYEDGFEGDCYEVILSEIEG